MRPRRAMQRAAWMSVLIACATDTIPAPGDLPPIPPDDLVLSTENIDFGNADCGGAAPADQTVTVSNRGSGTFTFRAASDHPQFSVAAGASATLPPGGMATVTLRSRAIARTAGPAVPQTALLVVTTDRMRDTPGHAVVRIRSRGGVIELAPYQVALGNVPVTQDAGLPTALPKLSNGGNATVGVILGQPSDDQIAVSYLGMATTQLLAPGDQLINFQIELHPKRVGPVSATIPVLVQGVLCQNQTRGEPSLSVIHVTANVM